MTVAGALSFAGARSAANNIEISLAEWSLHRTIRSGQLDHLDFPAKARSDFGIGVVEYVNGLFGDRHKDFREAGSDAAYLKKLLQRSSDAGVLNHLIMVDEEGPLSKPDDSERLQAVDNHRKWLDAASLLGCRTVRVNLHGDGDRESKKLASIDSLGRLGEIAKAQNLNIVVENHGHESSDAAWLAGVMRQVNLQNVGLLPDFGNFCLTADWGSTQEGCEEMYDRYEGVQQMLPFAKGGVSAKSYDFDAQGDQPLIDYERMIRLVKNSGFRGYIGIEFEGSTQEEEEGIRRTKALLEKYL